jgi:hypothetical protein
MDGKHSAWIGFVGGVGFAIAGAAFPAVFPSLPRPLAQTLLWSGVAVGAVSFVALLLPLLAARPRTSDERLALNTFLYMAELRGWVFRGAGQDALRLLDLMAQALADGVLVAWGRKREFNVLLEIPANEWRTLRIDLASAFVCRAPNGEIVGVQPDNAATSCFESGTAFTMKYTDLHVSGSSVVWMRRLT